MVTVINSWAQGIILAVIIASIIEIILPEGNNKKYVKTIIGIYILFVMIHPLISKISNKSIDINSVMKTTASKMEEYKSEDLTLETNTYIEETYKEKLKEDIKQKTQEKGYNIIFLNLDIETINEENYGQVNNIVIKISKVKEQEAENYTTENTINEIQSIEINVLNNTEDNNNQEEIEDVSKEEIESFKEYLVSTYGTSKENIHINESD